MSFGDIIFDYLLLIKKIRVTGARSFYGSHWRIYGVPLLKDLPCSQPWPGAVSKTPVSFPTRSFRPEHRRHCQANPEVPEGTTISKL